MVIMLHGCRTLPAVLTQTLQLVVVIGMLNTGFLMWLFPWSSMAEDKLGTFAISS